MKKTIIAIAFLAIGLTSCKTENKKVTTENAVEKTVEVKNPISSYKANITKSLVTWKGSKIASSHNGDIKIENGIFEITNGNINAGEFTINMNSINCLDLEGKKKAGLEGHLKNADFFDVATYPTSKFVITSSEVKNAKTYVTGNLTIKDVTKSITIPATIQTNEDGTASFKSDVFSFDRTIFGVTYKSSKIEALLKDKVINDLIEISFDIKAKK